MSELFIPQAESLAGSFTGFGSLSSLTLSSDPLKFLLESS